MKKVIVVVLFLFIGTILAFEEAENVLREVEVSSNDFSTQAIFFFSGSFMPKQKVVEDASKLTIFFPSVSIGQLDKDLLLKKLNKFGLIKFLRLDYKTIPKQGVLLEIQFNPGKDFVKLLHMDERKKFIIEIYSKAELEKKREASSGPLFLAQNLESKKKKNVRLRVMLDPGHGGLALGTQGLFNIIEKNLNLDIARKVKAILIQKGYEVALTRDKDENISLIDRCRITESFKADIFLSIHANSAGGSEYPHGIETYHINSKPFIGDLSKGGAVSYQLLFAKEDQRLVKVANNLINKNESISSLFANSIQTTLVNMLSKRKINIIDRGVKKSCFVVLLGLLNKIDLPSALVEVGFITNKNEARRLTDNNYRIVIAEGIAQGIQRFVATVKM